MICCDICFGQRGCVEWVYLGEDHPVFVCLRCHQDFSIDYDPAWERYTSWSAKLDALIEPEREKDWWERTFSWLDWDTCEGQGKRDVWDRQPPTGKGTYRTLTIGVSPRNWGLGPAWDRHEAGYYLGLSFGPFHLMFNKETV